MRLEILQNNEDYIMAVLDPTQHQVMRDERIAPVLPGYNCGLAYSLV